VNNAEFHGSDDNNVGQSNDQEIGNVEDDSHAENDAGNSVSFDDSDGGRNWRRSRVDDPTGAIDGKVIEGRT
jgi:hypothetical protein